MCDILQDGMNVRQAKKRAIVLAFLICFIFVSLFLKVFLLTHANHRHDCDKVGGACASCIQIRNAKELLKHFATASFAAAFIIAGLFLDVVITESNPSYIFIHTPVTLKTRMNH